MLLGIQMNYPHSSPAGAYRPDLIRIQYRSAFLMLMFQLYKKCEKGLRMGGRGGAGGADATVMVNTMPEFGKQPFIFLRKLPWFPIFFLSPNAAFCPLLPLTSRF